MVNEKVKNTIINNNLIEKNEHIVIGLSGGPDSVCLFNVLYNLREEFKLSIHAVHINHKIRPGAAEDDQAFVEELCRAYDVPCKVYCFDVNKIAKETGISSEDAGRRLRYQSFFEVAEDIKGKTGASVKIAVAQNLNDQAETVLMRVMRGTGTDGLAGIEYKRTEAGKWVIIRPLLDVSRQEIETYCMDNKLNPQIDLTNLEPIYTRNKVRLELIPYMQKNFNTNVMTAINRLSKIAKEDKDYFAEIIDNLIKEHGIFENNHGKKDVEKISISLEVLKKQNPAIRHRLVIGMFDKIGLSKDISAIHLEQADFIINQGKTSNMVEFSSGYIMELSYDNVLFYKKTKSIERLFEYEVNFHGNTTISELNSKLRVETLGVDLENKDCFKMAKESNGGYDCKLSYDKIRESNCKLVIRTRRKGDYIRPIGMAGRKKLQDYFVDRKVPREERDRIPVLCLGSEVVWIIGDRISENFKIGCETETIISLEYSFSV